jgi:hypothetical protein
MVEILYFALGVMSVINEVLELGMRNLVWR